MKQIFAENAPKAIGPYSHGYIAGGLFFSSGQIGANPDGSPMADTIEAQAEQSCRYSYAQPMVLVPLKQGTQDSTTKSPRADSWQQSQRVLRFQRQEQWWLCRREWRRADA